MGIDFDNLVKNVPCEGCEGIVPFAFDFIVGTESCLCKECCNEMSRVQEEVDRNWKAVEDETKARFDRTLALVGVPKMVAEIIGLQWNNQDPPIVKKGDNLQTAKVVSKYVNTQKRGILCLSGHNGLGKSVSACWAAWKTKGRFLGKSEWTLIQPWKEGSDDYQIRDLVSCQGVVVFDEVGSLTKAGEMNNPIRLVTMISTERHDRGLGTILTTRCKKPQFFEIYGNDMLDRMLHHESFGGSGWVEVTGRSLRAKEG